MQNPHITTAINQSPRSGSRKNYLEQANRERLGEPLLWSDAKHDPTQKEGGLFCFCFRPAKHTKNPRVEIHRIIGMASNRSYDLPKMNWGWSDIDDRNVLFLSNQICVIPWNTWTEITAINSPQSTQPMRNHRASLRLIKHVEEMIAKKNEDSKKEVKKVATNAALIAIIAAKSVSDCGWSEGKKPLWVKMMEEMQKQMHEKDMQIHEKDRQMHDKNQHIQDLSKDVRALKQQVIKQKDTLTMIFGASKSHVDRNDDSDDDESDSDDECF